MICHLFFHVYCVCCTFGDSGLDRVVCLAARMYGNGCLGTLGVFFLELLVVVSVYYFLWLTVYHLYVCSYFVCPFVSCVAF